MPANVREIASAIAADCIKVMITMILTYCMIANAQVCKEQHIQSDQMSFLACMTNGALQTASEKLAEGDLNGLDPDHPKWQLVKWSCSWGVPEQKGI